MLTPSSWSPVKTRHLAHSSPDLEPAGLHGECWLRSMCELPCLPGVLPGTKHPAFLHGAGGHSEGAEAQGGTHTSSDDRCPRVSVRSARLPPDELHLKAQVIHTLHRWAGAEALVQTQSGSF